jgi:hypothetical protein
VGSRTISTSAPCDIDEQLDQKNQLRGHGHMVVLNSRKKGNDKMKWSETCQFRVFGRSLVIKLVKRSNRETV